MLNVQRTLLTLIVQVNVIDKSEIEAMNFRSSMSIKMMSYAK